MAEILLTGASGYFGHAIYQALAPDVGITPLLGRLAEIRPGSLEPALVIHAAGALRHRQAECFASNVQGLASLLQGLKHPQTPVILFSSRAVYAPSSAPLTETSPLGSDEPYGQSKLQAERLLQESGHPYLILRPTLVWGWNGNQAGRSFIATAAQRLLHQEPVTLFDPPRDHDSLYVQDLARWMPTFLAPGPHWNQCFNLAAPPRALHTLITALAQELETQYGIRTELHHLPGPPPRAPLMDISKFKQTFPQLGWTPDEVILKDLVQHLR